MKKIFLFGVVSLVSYTKMIAQTNLPPVYEIKSDTAFRQDFANEYYQMLEDKEGKWTIEQVIAAPLADQFHQRNIKPATADTVVHTYWFRYSLKNITGHEISMAFHSRGENSDFYLFDSAGHFTHFLSGNNVAWSKKNGIKTNNTIPIKLKADEKMVVYYRINNDKAGMPSGFKIDILNNEKNLNRLFIDNQDTYYTTTSFFPVLLAGFLFMAALFNFFFFLTVKERMYLYFALWVLTLAILAGPLIDIVAREYPNIPQPFFVIVLASFDFFLLQFIRHYFQTFRYTKRWDKWLIGLIFVLLISYLFAFFIPSLRDTTGGTSPGSLLNIILISIVIISSFITLLIFKRLHHTNVKPFFIAVIPFLVSIAFILLMIVVITKDPSSRFDKLYNTLMFFSLIWMVVSFSWTLFRRYNNQAKALSEQALEIERIAREKEEERSRLIELQKTELEKQVLERTAELNNSLQNLRSTQSQLIQSEKMASLGELTAGIAHEIQNPLNFVNNFSDVNRELIDELNAERLKPNAERNEQLENGILSDIKENEQKINHHGKRADAIVKGMLQHSRSSSGVKEPTNINALADEYLRLAYHGLRAKDKSFNAKFETDFDNSIGKINLVPQEIGRVILNLINNAFYAVNEKQKHNLNGYEPTVIVSTKTVKPPLGSLGAKIEIKVKDNGNGISQKNLDKIFQPFFTTKPTGQGTGLGLSLAYDIITKGHGGELNVETKEGEGSEFIIKL
jgi:signal transduction histidine kinase